MPAWEPNADGPVGPKEMLGRRIFTDKIWEGEVGEGAKRFRIDHFYDSDREADFSIDRLGRAAEEGAVIRRVGRSAHVEALSREPPRPFTGWAACGRQHFATRRCQIEIRPKPLEDGTNPYHAEMVRDEFRGKTGPYAFATMMRDVFSLQGHFRNAPPPPKVKEGEELP